MDRYFFKMNPFLHFTEVERKKGHKEKEWVTDQFVWLQVVRGGVGELRILYNELIEEKEDLFKVSPGCFIS